MGPEYTHLALPELPDVTVYIEALERRILGRELRAIRLGSPFVLRSVEPKLAEAHGRRVRGLRRLGKRIAIELEGELFLVIHLMLAGRLHWKDESVKPGRRAVAAFELENGTLVLTEAGSQKRASLHLVRGAAALAEHDPGGVEVRADDLEGFECALRARNHTLKRALTDPRLLSGIGNAYSDEILHRAKLSPVQWTSRLDAGEMRRLHAAAVAVLREWTERLRAEAGDDFPSGVTAFREGMAVHGRYRQPCPDCGAPVQRILYASNETNYCASCQTGGRLLADRALSRLMKEDWPRTLEELEALRARGARGEQGPAPRSEPRASEASERQSE
jgi:formamidopyrimidine-DNA glycosylase